MEILRPKNYNTYHMIFAAGREHTKFRSCEGDIYIFSGFMPRALHGVVSMIEFAELGPTPKSHQRILEKEYGFISALHNYHIAFTSEECPEDYQWVDLINKSQLPNYPASTNYSSYFPHNRECIKVCFVGIDHTPISDHDE